MADERMAETVLYRPRSRRPPCAILPPPDFNIMGMREGWSASWPEYRRLRGGLPWHFLTWVATLGRVGADEGRLTLHRRAMNERTCHRYGDHDYHFCGVTEPA